MLPDIDWITSYRGGRSLGLIPLELRAAGEPSLDSPFPVATLVMRIEFDGMKRAETMKARGLDMARAAEVFAGPTLSVEDDRYDYGEVRYVTIGLLDEAMVVLVWTRRGDNHRIISMRRANERERRLYGPRL